MSDNNAWLDEMGNSPYARQLGTGFAFLRFARPLETRFRRFSLLQNRRLRLSYLYYGILMWVLFGVSDQLLIETAERWWMLLVRVVVLAVLLALARPVRQETDERKADLLMACVPITLGIGAAVIVAIGHSVDPGFPYEGLILIVFSVYFLVGLRLGQALAVSMLLVAIHALLESLAGYPSGLLVRNLLFLLSSNLIAAMGCYLLEYKSREHFLNHHLMRELADHDSLTGLHNRRSYNRKLENRWRQAQRDNVPLVLLLCDVDHFKAFNDCNGHQQGDQALRQLGQVIANAARRPLDIAVRMGGEEFAVLLYDMNREQALAHAESMRTELLRLAIPHAGSGTQGVLSISIGLAYVRPSVAKSMSVLYERADKALYRAKAAGRNRVVQWRDAP